ncbi:MAG: hypothetical protein ACK5N8_03310 [Alphaproteobacteria bacterium]
MFKKIYTPILALTMLFSFAGKAEAFDYEQCMDRARGLGDLEMAKCKHSQTTIELNELKQDYNAIAQGPEYKTVISANDLKRMYNAWQIYRDTYCKAFINGFRVASVNAYASQVELNNAADYYYEHCLQEFTSNAKDYMFALKSSVVPEEHDHKD